uniref:Uncharacterized protein n=1 Tax=Haematococcus lacustris TaxID=44745 RepID=A0A2K9YS00_HAELA|nr:hypothetical protein SG3EUKT977465.1 [Haematococcus lacustris]AUW36560.1 hypothetical protein SG3EUKT977465.1 [Haematococcus lacustris]
MEKTKEGLGGPSPKAGARGPLPQVWAGPPSWGSGAPAPSRGRGPRVPTATAPVSLRSSPLPLRPTELCYPSVPPVRLRLPSGPATAPAPSYPTAPALSFRSLRLRSGGGQPQPIVGAGATSSGLKLSLARPLRSRLIPSLRGLDPYLVIRPLIYLFVPLFTYKYLYLLIRPFIYLFIPLFTYKYTYLLIWTFIYLFGPPPNPEATRGWGPLAPTLGGAAFGLGAPEEKLT